MKASIRDYWNLKAEGELLRENEEIVNRQHQMIIKASFWILLIGSIYTMAIDEREYLLLDLGVLLFGIVCFVGLSLFHRYCSVQSKSYKYLILLWFFVPFSVIITFTMDNMWIGFAIPILMSCRYYNLKLVAVMSAVTQFFLVIAHLSIVYIQPWFGYARAGSILWPEGTVLTGEGMSINELAAKLLVDGTVSWSQYRIRHFWEHAIYHNLILFFLSMICMMITVQEIRILRRQAQMLEEKRQMDLELAESRNRAMLSQMQPHFIFNVLNSIYELCDINVVKAQRMISAFSQYLRHDIDSLTIQGTIPFEKELDSVNNYLTLEKMRFGDRLKVKLDIDVDDFRILPLTIQPLVENAVKHGICKLEQGGTVRIVTREMEKYILVRVEDDGVGFDPEEEDPKTRRRVGLSNVTNRLQQQLGAKVTVESEPGIGTKVEILLPKEENV